MVPKAVTNGPIVEWGLVLAVDKYITQQKQTLVNLQMWQYMLIDALYKSICSQAGPFVNITVCTIGTEAVHVCEYVHSKTLWQSLRRAYPAFTE